MTFKPDAPSRPEVCPEVRLGSQLFINREDSPEQVRGWVRQMGDCGLKLIRLFVFWDMVEPAPGEWRWEVFDAAFEEAATCGLKIVPTLYPSTTPGWRQQLKNNQEVWFPEEDALWQEGLDSVRRVGERWKAHPALDSWILMNEPGYRPPHTPGVERCLQRFLERHYGSIEALNAQYYPQFERFDQLCIRHLAEQQGGPVPALIGRIDWHRFAVDYLMGKLREIRDVIRAIDPTHPVHLNPHMVTQEMSDSGQSIWREGESVDFLGCSAHIAWHSLRFPRARIPQSVGMFCALMRSATRQPDGHFWVSELQGGMALVSGLQAWAPGAIDIRSLLWESVGRGAKAVVYWCFNTRRDGIEAGEWSLLDFEGGVDTPRLRETAAVAETLQRHAALLTAARPPQLKVRILHSEASSLVAFTGGIGEDKSDPRNKQQVMDAIAGAFMLFDDLGVPVDFLDEPRLREGDWMAETELLVLPGCVALEDGTLEKVRDFVAGGGRVVADDFLGWKDANGRVDHGRGELIREIFGTTVRDVEIFEPAGPDERATVDAGWGGWLFRALFRSGEQAEVVETWQDGPPAVLRNRSEKGEATWIGSRFFQRYFVHQEDAARDWLSETLKVIDRADEPLQVDPTGPEVRMLPLELPEGRLYVLINSGSARRLRFTLTDGARAEILDGKALESGDALELEADAVRLIHCSKFIIE